MKMEKFDTQGFKLDSKVKAKWVKALRSEKYRQGVDQLKSDDKFCCLGVACELGLTEDRGDAANVRNDFLPQYIQVFLQGRNDGTASYGVKRWSFKRIADWIEKNL